MEQKTETMEHFNIGEELQQIRERRHLLKTSLISHGMQPAMINTLESGKGNVANLLKYLSILGVKIELHTTTPYDNNLYVYRTDKKLHLSYGNTTICGKITNQSPELMSVIDGSLKLKNSEKSQYCKRCLDGYNKREKQKNLPLG